MRYRLRWGYEYLNGSRKTGSWSQSGPKNDLHTKAWANNKNIRYAFIEREDTLDPVTKEIVRCSADEFMNFQWITLASMQPFYIKGAVVPLTRIGGLTMLTTTCAVDCLDNGTVKKLPPRHLQTQFATYGR